MLAPPLIVWTSRHASLASYAGGYGIWLAYGLSTGSIPLIVVDNRRPCSAQGLTLAVALSLRGSLSRPGHLEQLPMTRHHLRNEMDSISEESSARNTA